MCVPISLQCDQRPLAGYSCECVKILRGQVEMGVGGEKGLYFGDHHFTLLASLLPQLVKNLPAMQEIPVPSLGSISSPWRREWLHTPVFFFFYNVFIYFLEANSFTIFYGFCHTLT